MLGCLAQPYPAVTWYPTVVYLARRNSYQAGGVRHAVIDDGLGRYLASHLGLRPRFLTQEFVKTQKVPNGPFEQSGKR